MKAFSLGSLRLLASSGLLFALAGTVIAFTCRDRWQWSALILYAAPWFLRLGAGCFAWLMLRKSHKAWPIAAVLCVLAASAEATRSWGHAEAAPAANRPDEIVLWNSARCLQKHPDEWPSVANPSTFLVALIETGAFDAPTWQRFCATHPSLQWRRLDGGVSLGTAGTIESVENLSRYVRYRLHRVKIRDQGAVWTVFVTDIVSQPWFDREPTLAAIRREAGNDPRTIILGDFNTPSQSLFYDAWRSSLALANDHHTAGFAETWCYGLPVMTLDQIWHSRDVSLSPVTMERSLISDHARVRCRIRR